MRKSGIFSVYIHFCEYFFFFVFLLASSYSLHFTPKMPKIFQQSILVHFFFSSYYFLYDFFFVCAVYSCVTLRRAYSLFGKETIWLWCSAIQHHSYSVVVVYFFNPIYFFSFITIIMPKIPPFCMSQPSAQSKRKSFEYFIHLASIIWILERINLKIIEFIFFHI